MFYIFIHIMCEVGLLSEAVFRAVLTDVYCLCTCYKKYLDISA